MRILAVAIAVLAAGLAAGCDEASEFRLAPVGGGTVTQPARPGSRTLAPSKMLEDAEEYQDDAIALYAGSQAEALAKCEQEAARRGPARCLGCSQKTFSKPPYRFICTIRGDR